MQMPASRGMIAFVPILVHVLDLNLEPHDRDAALFAVAAQVRREEIG